MAREKTKVLLPKEYQHPFDCPVVSMKASFSTKGLPEDCKVPAFEFILSTVKLDLKNAKVAGASCIQADKFLKERYNLSLQDLVDKGLSQLSYSIDDKVIGIIYKGLDEGFTLDHNPVDAATHLEAQKAVDNWKWTPSTGKGKTTKVATMVQSLVAKGFLPESAVDDITTDAELQSAITNAAGVE